MIARALGFLLDYDWTAVHAVLVWAGVLLAVAWLSLMREDPANAGLPEWDLRLRRVGVVIVVAGFLIAVLFGGERLWTPWPPMVIVAFGFDFYLAATIFTVRRRARLRDRLAAMGRVDRGRPTAAR
jgi:hypothetical protein